VFFSKLSKSPYGGDTFKFVVLTFLTGLTDIKLPFEELETAGTAAVFAKSSNL